MFTKILPCLLAMSLCTAALADTPATAAPTSSSASASTSSRAQASALEAGTFETTDHVALHYDIVGHGSPAIFVHGGPGSGSGAFRVLAGPAFERDFRMIYLDQRGSGKSASASSGDYTLDRQVEDLESLRQSMKIDRWTVVAYSFGGLIAQAYAEKYPQHVRAMIMVSTLLDLGQSMQSTYERGLSLIPEQARPHFDDKTPFPQRYFTVLAMLKKMGLVWQLQYASEATQRAADAKVDGMDFGHNHDMAKSVFGAPPTSYLRDLIATTRNTRAPVLVIAGEDDAAVGPQQTRFAYPHMRLVTLPGRHNTFVEAPAAFADAIHQFAKANGLAAKRH